MKGCKINNKAIQILIQLNSAEEGLRAESIIKLTQLKGRTVYYHLKVLMREGIIIHNNPYYKIAKNFRESQDFAKLLKKKENFLLCDLSFVVRLIRKPSWWDKRENSLRRIYSGGDVKKVELRNNSYFQIKNYKHYIQTFSDSIIFILSEKYYGVDPYDCFIVAVKNFIEIYTYFESKLGFRFFEEGIPNVTIRSQNYVKLRDAIAEHCKKTGDKFEVWVDGKKILYVDMSEPLGMESDNRNSAPDNIKVYAEYVRDIEVNKPPMMSEMACMIKVLVEDRKYYAENLKSHVGAIQTLDNTAKEGNLVVIELKKEVSSLSQVVNDLKILIQQSLNRQ